MAGEGAVAAKLQRDRPDTQRPGTTSGSPTEPSGINAAERYRPLKTLQTFRNPGNNHPRQAGRAGAVMPVR